MTHKKHTWEHNPAGQRYPHPAGRHCECGHQLSRYNPGPHCNQCLAHQLGIQPEDIPEAAAA